MLRRNILCHRGYWESPDEQNTRAAFEHAVNFGFGIETDIRDFATEVVIAHNPFEPNELLLSDFVREFALNSETRIALNVKSDGISGYCQKIFNGFEQTNYFFFDMSIPEHVQYVQKGLPTYSRLSDFEPTPFEAKGIQGIWVDSFLTDFDLSSLDENGQLVNKKLCFVSPELHGRDPVPFWKSLTELDKVMDFEICTDLPFELLDLLGEF